jgi:UDP-N-acetylmuramoylalanine--D-glutamate ligase
MKLKDLRSKKIAVAGMGVNNAKLAEYLSRKKINFQILQWKKPDDLIGKLDKFDVVFRTPGLPYFSKAIQQAKKRGVEISSQTKFFFELCPSKIIGVTGTKGKGTTSSLIYKILSAARRKVWLGGNMGKDPFEFLDQIKSNDLVVLELSSFQVEDMDRSPYLAVVLNITPDHLDYHQTMQEYVQAKLNIIAHQTKFDFAIMHPALSKYKNLGKGKKIFFDPNTVVDFKTKLLGKHNLENIAAAVEVAKIFSVKNSLIRNAIAEFEPLPHRLQKIAIKNGVRYFDDSLATNEDTTIAAINAFHSSLVLILGGQAKKTGYKRVADLIKRKKNIKAVVVVGVDTLEILKELKGYKGKILTGAKNMKEIVKQAQSLSEKNDTVLLSPAATSFDMFKNYADRGEQFIKSAKSL